VMRMRWRDVDCSNSIAEQTKWGSASGDLRSPYHMETSIILTLCGSCQDACARGSIVFPIAPSAARSA